ncbi:MAG TPA: nuclear transport factor 2 family protein [Protaetiibacter sp.]|nr:nuclear transport factor 2 family protein [Protaetiibacter sp.]
MTDRSTVEQWVSRYRTAWESNDPDDIRALFTPDAEYFTGPSEQPWRGHDGIVAQWLENADRPGQTSCEFVELDPDGRARRFTEWYMERPDSA